MAISQRSFPSPLQPMVNKPLSHPGSPATLSLNPGLAPTKKADGTVMVSPILCSVTAPSILRGHLGLKIKINHPELCVYPLTQSYLLNPITSSASQVPLVSLQVAQIHHF